MRECGKKLNTKNKIFLVLLPVFSALIALSVGRMVIPFDDVIKVILNDFGQNFEVSSQSTLVINSIRIPRILTALLVGCGLSLSGSVFQSLFKNPLATPDTVGVAGGASFGAALGILLGFGFLGIEISAILFGIFAVILTYIAGGKTTKNMSVFILSGVMISSLFSGLISLVKYTADTESQLPQITYFLMGSLSGAGYKNFVIGAPIIVFFAIFLYLIRWKLNLLLLSNDEAETSGSNMILLKAFALICASSMTAASVAMCGQVGWVGLLIPHIVRMKYGNNHTSVIPASALIGGTFMVVVDTIARTVTASEIPVSVLTSIIGAPFFIILMRKGKGWQL